MNLQHQGALRAFQILSKRQPLPHRSTDGGHEEEGVAARDSFFHFFYFFLSGHRPPDGEGTGGDQLPIQPDWRVWAQEASICGPQKIGTFIWTAGVPTTHEKC